MKGLCGISSFGGYVPRLRLERAIIAEAHACGTASGKLQNGQRAIAKWDEDVVTMAVEAARSCLASRSQAAVGAVSLGSTTAPFADRQNAGIAKEAWNLEDTIGTLDIGGSRRAGTSALLAALAAARSESTDQLCIAVDKPRTQPASEAELSACDAAAAVHAGRALEITLEFVKQRKLFDKTLGAFQNTRFECADVRVGIDLCQACIEHCVLELLDGHPTADVAAEAKLAASEIEGRVIDECVQLHGGAGYMEEYEICRMFTNARVSRIYAGSSEVMREVIGRSMGPDERKLDLGAALKDE